MHGKHPLRHWSNSQATPSLSSTEAECKGITKGCIEGLYIKNMLNEHGHNFELEIQTDSSGAVGMSKRLGTGKRAKHLEIQDLWVQHLTRNKVLTLTKISTHDNVADIFTKYVSQFTLNKHCKTLGYTFPDEENQDSSFEESKDVSDEYFDMDEADNVEFENNLYALLRGSTHGRVGAV